MCGMVDRSAQLPNRRTQLNTSIARDMPLSYCTSATAHRKPEGTIKIQNTAQYLIATRFRATSVAHRTIEMLRSCGSQSHVRSRTTLRCASQELLAALAPEITALGPSQSHVELVHENGSYAAEAMFCAHRRSQPLVSTAGVMRNHSGSSGAAQRTRSIHLAPATGGFLCRPCVGRQASQSIPHQQPRA